MGGAGSAWRHADCAAGTAVEASQAAGLGQRLTAACAVEAPVVNSRVSGTAEHMHAASLQKQCTHKRPSKVGPCPPCSKGIRSNFCPELPKYKRLLADHQDEQSLRTCWGPNGTPRSACARILAYAGPCVHCNTQGMPGTIAKPFNTSDTAGCKLAADISFALDSGLSFSKGAALATESVCGLNSCSHASAHAVVVSGPDRG